MCTNNKRNCVSFFIKFIPGTFLSIIHIKSNSFSSLTENTFTNELLKI